MSTHTAEMVQTTPEAGPQPGLETNPEDPRNSPTRDSPTRDSPTRDSPTHAFLVELDLKSRIILSSLIGSFPAGTISQLRALLEIHKQVSLSAKEMEDIQFSISGQQINWVVPSFDYGNLSLSLGPQQAMVLKQTLEFQLESWEREGVTIGMSDFVVIQRVLDQLS